MLLTWLTENQSRFNRVQTYIIRNWIHEIYRKIKKKLVCKDIFCSTWPVEWTMSQKFSNMLLVLIFFVKGHKNNLDFSPLLKLLYKKYQKQKKYVWFFLFLLSSFVCILDPTIGIEFKSTIASNLQESFIFYFDFLYSYLKKF